MDEPVQHFRGVNAPAELFDLVQDGVITDAQAWLALTIDSFVNSRGEGCWASNRTLAKKTHKEIRYVQKNLTRLLELGLVYRVGWKTVNGKKMRILETKWSRVYINTDVLQDMGVDRKTDVLQDMGNKNTDVLQDTQDLRSSISKIELDEFMCRSRTRDTTNIGKFTNPYESPSPLPHLGVPLDSELVDFLRSVAVEVENISLDESREAWVKRMGVLRRHLKDDRDRLKRVLGSQWYKDHAGRNDVPIITCAKGIKVSIFKWIENLIKKDHKERNVRMETHPNGPKWERQPNGTVKPVLPKIEVSDREEDSSCQ